MLIKKYQKLIRDLNRKRQIESFKEILRLFNIPVPKEFVPSKIRINFDEEKFVMKNIETEETYQGVLNGSQFEITHDLDGYYTTRYYDAHSDKLNPTSCDASYSLKDGDYIYLKVKDKSTEIKGHKLDQIMLELHKLVKSGKKYKVVFSESYGLFPQFDNAFQRYIFTKDGECSCTYMYEKALDVPYFFNIKERKSSGEIIESAYSADKPSDKKDEAKKLQNNAVVQSFKIKESNIVIVGHYWYAGKEYDYSFKAIKKGQNIKFILESNNDPSMCFIKTIYLSQTQSINSDDVDRIIDFVRSTLPDGYVYGIFGELELVKQTLLKTEFLGTDCGNYIEDHLKNYENFEQMSFDIFYDLNNINEAIDAKTKKDINAVMLKLKGNKEQR